MDKLDKEIFLYTDGSSIGNPGPGGYGIIMELKGTTYKKEFSNNYFSKVVYHKGNLKYMDLDYLGTDFFKILGDSSFTFVSNNTLNGDYDPWLRSSYGSCHKAKYE